MAGKRGASHELNHDNWNVEEEPEEAGVFAKAPEDILRKRTFKTAKRRITRPPEEGSSSVFNPLSLSKFGPKASQPSSQMFGFLSKLSTPDSSKINGIDNKSNKESDVESKTISFTFGNKKTENETSQQTVMGDMNTEVSSNPLFNFKNPKNETKPVSFNFGVSSNNEKLEQHNPLLNFNNNKKSNNSENESLDNYYAKLKGLNESVAKWINKHVESNPLINLQPIFKDYEKFFDEIEKEKIKTKNAVEHTKKEQTNKIDFSFTKNEQSGFSTQQKPQNENKIEKPLPATTFSFGIPNNSVPNTSAAPKFSFGTENNTVTSSEAIPKFSFGTGSLSSAPINFGITTQSSSSTTDNNKEEEDSEEPPKVEVKEVEEEGNIYSIRCKLFVKKDGNFVEKGVGNLFLKPVPDSEKIQIIVRAHNSLANVLCNFILTKSHPTQKMGKNNVMIVCLPTPESQPPPVPMLIRVKTEDDANQLLETLEKYKK